jgi:hypothetical protein
MIRDPSDGSVKEITSEANKINTVAPKQAPKEIGPDTGIRQPVRTDAQERLERSRQWLKDYQERKAAHARGSNDAEHSTDGSAGNGQREGESAIRAGDRADAGTHRQG